MTQTTRTRRVNRPHLTPGPKPRYRSRAVLNAVMEADDKAAIVALGGGNGSEGIRRLLAFWREQKGATNGNGSDVARGD